jgi:uncharacterized repeat protein (TIGR02543 family)
MKKSLLPIILLFCAGAFAQNPPNAHAAQGGTVRPALLKITTDPPEAAVKIDDRDYGLSPVEAVGLDTGSHVVELSKGGYFRRKVRIRLGPAGAELHFELNRPAALLVTSEPDGAQITINGQNMGAAPTRSDKMRPGKYQVSADLDGYKTFETTAVLEAGGACTLSVKLEPNATATPPVAAAQHAQLASAPAAPELPKTYTLTVYANIANGGTVARNPNYSAYYAGTQVVLTAAPGVGHAFDGWSGAASTRDSSITVTVNDNVTLTANFRLLPPPPPPPPPPAPPPVPAAQPVQPVRTRTPASASAAPPSVPVAQPVQSAATPAPDIAAPLSVPVTQPAQPEPTPAPDTAAPPPAPVAQPAQPEPTPAPDTAAPPPAPVAQPVQPAPDTAAPTAGPPNIAVYVTGEVPDEEKRALGTRILASLVNSGRYKGIERSNTFLAEIDKEMEKQMSGAIDDNQISKVGKQFGVKFICIVDITPAYESFQVSARIVNVETAEVAYIGEAFCPHKTALYITWVSEQVVRKMFGEKLLPEPHDPSRIRISAGAGALVPGDFGGGTSYGNRERAVMPYTGFGAYLFADAMYAEAFFGYSSGGGKWRSANTAPESLPEMERSYLHMGVTVKYPFGAGWVKFSPLIGLDYDLSIGGKLQYEDGEHYVFNGKNGRLGSNALSAMWVRIGGGLDFDVSRSVYLRSEFLYGMRTANDWEHDAASGGSGQTALGHGFILKVGLGMRFAELKF